MKLKINLLLIISVLFFAACSSDNDKDDVIPPDTSYAGVYDGTLGLSVSGTSQGTDDDSRLTIAAQDNNKAKLTLKGFGIGTMALEDIVVPDVDVVKKSDGSYTFASDINTTSGTSTVTGTVSGTIVDGKVNFVYVIKPGSMPMPITATFTNEKPEVTYAGIYDGTLDLSVSGASQGTEDDSKLTIVALENNKAKLTLKGFGVGSMALEDIVVDDADVVKGDDGSFTITSDINTTSGTLTVTGTVSGTIIDGKANFVYVIKPGAMPMPITATFISE